METLEYTDLQTMITDFDNTEPEELESIISSLEDYTDADKRLEGAIKTLSSVIQNNAGTFVFPQNVNGKHPFEDDCKEFNNSIKTVALSGKTEKEKALIDFLKVPMDEFDYTENNPFNENEINSNGCDYLVLTNEEADDATHDAISGLAFSFNADFIISHSKALDYDAVSYAIITAIQEQDEGGNEAMKRLIDDFDEFVAEAIRADGRGHFLSGYDGTELETRINGVYYFIYRTN